MIPYNKDDIHYVCLCLHIYDRPIIRLGPITFGGADSMVARKTPLPSRQGRPYRGKLTRRYGSRIENSGSSSPPSSTRGGQRMRGTARSRWDPCSRKLWNSLREFSVQIS